MTCPHCGEAARFINYRPKDFLSVLGELELHRAYYHCKHCHNGYFPWDHLLRLSPNRLTPGRKN